MKASMVRRLALAVAAVMAASPASAQHDTQPSSGAPAVAGTDDFAVDDWTHWTGGRYRITPGDVVEFTFPFVPEFNQVVTVQPDGYIALKEVSDLRAQGRTVAQLKTDVMAAYGAFLRDPSVNVSLKEFESPYFVASGAVENPGRYELRGATTLTQALALAGGPAIGANTRRVVLLRRYGTGEVDAKEINVSRMHSQRDLSEDPLLRPGDTILVPKGPLGKLYPLLEVLRWP